MTGHIYLIGNTIVRDNGTILGLTKEDELWHHQRFHQSEQIKGGLDYYDLIEIARLIK
jgi:hypothetical protein